MSTTWYVRRFSGSGSGSDSDALEGDPALGPDPLVLPVGRTAHRPLTGTAVTAMLSV
jgi:hypothetical protein